MKQAKDTQPSRPVNLFTYFLDIKVSTRLISGFTIIALIGVIVGSSGLYYIYKIDNNLNRITDITAPTVETADDLIANIWEAMKVAEEVIANEELQQLPALVLEFDKLSDEFQQTYVELTTIVIDENLLDELEAVKSGHVEFIRAAHEMFETHSLELEQIESADQLLIDFDIQGIALITSLDEFAADNQLEMANAEEEGDRLERSGASAGDVNRVLGGLYDQDYPVVEASFKFQRLILEMQDSVREYMVEESPEKLTEIRGKYEQNKRLATPYLNLIKQLSETEKESQDINQLEALFNNWILLAEQNEGLFKIHLNYLDVENTADNLAERLDLDADNMAGILNQVADFADAINDGADEETAAVVEQARNVVAVLLFLTVLSSAFLIAMVIKTVTRPIQTLTRTMASLGAGDEPTSLSEEQVRNDEIGELASTFNTLISQLRAATKNLEDQVQNRTTELYTVNKNLEEELELRRSLESQLVHAQKLDSLGTLAGGVAHDFNNMLYVISGSNQLAQDLVKPDSEIGKHLKRIGEAADRSHEIVSQILYFSRQERLDRKPVMVAKVIDDAIKLVRAGLPSTIKLDVSISDKCGSILADETQIHQLIVNLTTNAFHAYQESKGTVSVSLIPINISEKSARKHVGLRSGTYVKLSIQDEGIGIKEEHFTKIFDPFFTTKEVGEGTGLGLAVVHGIVTAHDGVIMFESTPCVGTQFDVYLPEIDDENIK